MSESLWEKKWLEIGVGSGGGGGSWNMRDRR